MQEAVASTEIVGGGGTNTEVLVGTKNLRMKSNY